MDYYERASKQSNNQQKDPEEKENLMRRLLNLLDCSDINPNDLNPRNSPSINNFFLDVICKHVEFQNR